VCDPINAVVNPIPRLIIVATYARQYTRMYLKTPWLGPRANYADRATALVGEVVPTFAARGCCVVNATDPPRSLVSVFLTGAATISSK
jgi:hypothetical protein